TAPETASLERCPYRREFAETAFPASICRRAHRRAPCRHGRCGLPKIRSSRLQRTKGREHLSARPIRRQCRPLTERSPDPELSRATIAIARRPGQSTSVPNPKFVGSRTWLSANFGFESTLATYRI